MRRVLFKIRLFLYNQPSSVAAANDNDDHHRNRAEERNIVIVTADHKTKELFANIKPHLL